MILIKINNLIKITEDIYLESLAYAAMSRGAADGAAAAARHVENIKQIGRNLHSGWKLGTLKRGKIGKILGSIPAGWDNDQFIKGAKKLGISEKEATKLNTHFNNIGDQIVAVNPNLDTTEIDNHPVRTISTTMPAYLLSKHRIKAGGLVAGKYGYDKYKEMKNDSN